MPSSQIAHFGHMPGKTAGELTRNSRSILHGPGPNALLLITCRTAAPQGHITLGQQIVAIEQKRIIRLMRIDVDDAPFLEPKRLKHVDLGHAQPGRHGVYFIELLKAPSVSAWLQDNELPVNKESLRVELEKCGVDTTVKTFALNGREFNLSIRVYTTDFDFYMR